MIPPPPRGGPVTADPWSGGALPFLIVAEVSEAVAPGSTCSTRSSPAPSTTLLRAPRPAIVRSPETSRSPVAEASSLTPGIDSITVPAGRTTVSAPGEAFASWTAARSVHAPAAVAHAASPGWTSTTSAVEFTSNVRADAVPATVPAISTASDSDAASRITARACSRRTRRR
jgi:hypothetical protein